jgi:Flp pilus assembly protein TadG
MIKLMACRRAASAVEFAMLLPVFLSLVFGIVVYGSYFTVIHGLQQLAAEAARASIGGMSEAQRNAIATSYVSANVGTYPLIVPGSVTVVAASSVTNANIFVVTVNYNASQMFIYSLPVVPLPPSAMTQSAAIAYGGF